MKKRALCALASLVLCVSLTGPAYAAESGVSFEVNGTSLVTEFATKVENEMTYVSYWPTVQALYPDAVAVWNNGQAEVAATGMALNGMYTAFGGTLFNDDGTLADLNEATNKTAMSEMLDFCKYLIGNGYTQENLKLKDYRASFGAGNVCMYVDQSWGYAQIGEVDANAANFTVTAPLPTQLGTNGKGLSLVSAHSFLFGAGLEDSHKEAIDLFIQYCTSNEVMEGYLNNIGLAFPAHENMADCKISPILEGAAKGVNNTVYQPMPAALASVQTEMATAALNYTVNGMSLDDTIADFITQAEYYMNQ